MLAAPAVCHHVIVPLPGVPAVHVALVVGDFVCRMVHAPGKRLPRQRDGKARIAGGVTVKQLLKRLEDLDVGDRRRVVFSQLVERFRQHRDDFRATFPHDERRCRERAHDLHCGAFAEQHPPALGKAGALRLRDVLRLLRRQRKPCVTRRLLDTRLHHPAKNHAPPILSPCFRTRLNTMKTSKSADCKSHRIHSNVHEPSARNHQRS